VERWIGWRLLRYGARPPFALDRLRTERYAGAFFKSVRMSRPVPDDSAWGLECWPGAAWAGKAERDLPT
jgi:hypothetical protein